MRYVKSGPNEYLVVGRRGQVVNCGTAAGVFVWPGSTCVRVPATKQETRFEMTQETRDGIPLRFKGIVIYRVADPVATATMFDFSGAGCEEMKTLIGHICLGELRATAAHLTMTECIEQRKTTLTDAVRTALTPVVSEGGGWGIELDVVQVAQVFIVDDDLRRRLEAGVRNELASRSSRSEIQMKEEIGLAQLASDRRLQEEALESERKRTAFEGEKLRLARELQEAAIEAETPVKRLRLERAREILEQEIAVLRVENEATALKVEGEAIGERVRQALRLEMLPLEQAPAIAEALAKVFQGAQLSVYGAEAKTLAPLSMLLDLLAARLRAGGSREAPESVA